MTFTNFIVLDIIHSGESLSVKNEVKLPVQGNCTKCGYISSQPLCKACVLLEGLNRGLPRFDFITRTENAGDIIIQYIVFLF